LFIFGGNSLTSQRVDLWSAALAADQHECAHRSQRFFL